MLVGWGLLWVCACVYELDVQKALNITLFLSLTLILSSSSSIHLCIHIMCGEESSPVSIYLIQQKMNALITNEMDED